MVTTCWEHVACVSLESQERGSWSGLKDIPVAWRLPSSVLAVSKYDLYKPKLCSYWSIKSLDCVKQNGGWLEISTCINLERRKHSVVGIPCMKIPGLQSWLSPIQIVRRLWNSWSWPQLQRCSKILHCRLVSLCRLQYGKDIQWYESKKQIACLALRAKMTCSV